MPLPSERLECVVPSCGREPIMRTIFCQLLGVYVVTPLGVYFLTPVGILPARLWPGAAGAGTNLLGGVGSSPPADS